MTAVEYGELDDRSLVDLLLQDDEGAWNYLLVEVITPICYTRKYLEICTRYSLPVDSLITQVWLILRKNDYNRLRIFSFRASLKTYLFIIVREAQRYELKEKIGKIPYSLSEDDTYCSLIESRKTADSFEIKDEMAVANEVLAQLWRDNPQHAWVLLMRNSLNLSSKEVALFLDETVSNVDQMNKRAKSKLKQYRSDFK